MDQPKALEPGTTSRAKLSNTLSEQGFALGNPAFIRLFKTEKRLELWLARNGQRFACFRHYPIRAFSGHLGPKLAEGDLQAPEGFYRVGIKQLNPRSRHHLAFNLGFPNVYDQALERTGSALMVHGGCTSRGCYAMTDVLIEEIYVIVEAALLAGQEAVDVQALPFVLTDGALTHASTSPWFAFWTNLKQGFDLFEQTRTPPVVGACNGYYRFGSGLDAAGGDEIGYWR
ncbi:2-dehydro-3-deoxyphosphooctonate aldolase [Devosia rhodophyticola]|uniref:2-dehydro-3-deoxyphosphooctonate aldolase n=1 Tax=Devosia rhodophyticola TaxID=3026423 RepID=A0ABY7YU37_9HYPH|nr:2-dehydro-3-deoxyphosphooctonate aldolase [Devosia rhodophyticola]WDR04692.1 2-dehydro-3-deoxyphosphooctonate aldolase [Devosia rhodophyticola]